MNAVGTLAAGEGDPVAAAVGFFFALLIAAGGVAALAHACAKSPSPFERVFSVLAGVGMLFLAFAAAAMSLFVGSGA